MDKAAQNMNFSGHFYRPPEQMSQDPLLKQSTVKELTFLMLPRSIVIRVRKPGRIRIHNPRYIRHLP